MVVQRDQHQYRQLKFWYSVQIRLVSRNNGTLTVVTGHPSALQLIGHM